MTRVGFICVGVMGREMVRNLQDSVVAVGDRCSQFGTALAGDLSGLWVDIENAQAICGLNC